MRQEVSKIVEPWCSNILCVLVWCSLHGQKDTLAGGDGDLPHLCCVPWLGESSEASWTWKTSGQETNQQVRLCRATLEFQVPTGLKVFNSQLIYLISFTKIFRLKKTKTFRFQKKFGRKKFWVTALEKLTMKKFVSKKILDLTWPVTTWVDLFWLNLTSPDLTCPNLTSHVLS